MQIGEVIVWFRTRHETFDGTLKLFEFQSCDSNKYLYWKKNEHLYIILCLCVDDILTFGEDPISLKGNYTMFVSILSFQNWWRLLEFWLLKIGHNLVVSTFY